MAGHSHWAGIKHKKATADAKRGKLFSKLARRIIVAAREGGGNPEKSLKLKQAIDEARRFSMPGDSIDRAIKKGSGELATESYAEVVYEGYAPGGVALLIDILTDNRNRTAGEIRTILEKRGGSLGATGCAAWMFEKKGVFTVPAASVSEEKIMEAALEAGADDVTTEGPSYIVTCPPKTFEQVKDGLAKAGLAAESAQIVQLPHNKVPVNEETARKILALCDALDEHDDVQNVYTNFDIPEEVLRKIAAAT